MKNRGGGQRETVEGSTCMTDGATFRTVLRSSPRRDACEVRGANLGTFPQGATDLAARLSTSR